MQKPEQVSAAWAVVIFATDHMAWPLALWIATTVGPLTALKTRLDSPSPMSQRDIATELFVSLNTVKTHCRAIFRNLAVSDRKAAVQAARDAVLL